uniref:Integrase catalytic domain-containing protein n=1 Tax=Amphimedon queenslandica TaxID=400682 RepID=A0A1X7SLU5_AMPQE
MLSTLLSKTVEVLKHLFSMYVLLEQLVSDNGPQFPSDEFHQFIKSSGIKHYCSATYHPATKGAAEKFVQMLKQALKTEKQAGKPTKEVLFQFLMSCFFLTMQLLVFLQVSCSWQGRSGLN